MAKIKKFCEKPLSPCHCMKLRRAAKSITAYYNKQLEKSGLTIIQMGILRTIDSKSAVGISELASLLDSDRTTMNRNLKPLEDNRYLQIKPGKDARKKEVCLTEKGRTALKTALEGWTDAQEAVREYVGDETFDSFARVLSMIEGIVS